MSNGIEEKNIIEETQPIKQPFSILNELFNTKSQLHPLLNKFNASLPDQTPKSFKTLINEQLTHMKESMLALLFASQNELSAQYDDYISQLNIFLTTKEEKLNSINQINLKSNNISACFDYIEKTIFSKFISLIEIHSNIQSAIEKNIGILISFLEKQDLIKEDEPLEAFLFKESNNIFSSWLMTQFNFTNINLSHLLHNNSGMITYCKKFLCLKAEKNSKTIDIRKNSSTSFEAENYFIKNNANLLEKISIFNINTEDLMRYYPKDKRDNKMFPNKIASLLISKSDLKDYDWTNCLKDSNYLIEHLQFKKVMVNPSFIRAFTFLPDLKHIHLGKCNLNDRNFDCLLDILRNNEKITNNLKVLSLPGNHFTYIKVVFSSTAMTKKKNGFSALSELNLESNNIYDFSSENFNYLPQLKVLNLSFNNISSFSIYSLIQEKNKTINCLLLLSGNLNVINNKNHNSDYVNYLTEILPVFDYPVKTMSFALLFNRFTIEKVNNITLGVCANIYLMRLNLSYCSLNTDILLQFLRKNNGLVNLTHLKVSNNIIDIRFFDEYNKDSNIQIDKLKKLDFSHNSLRLTKETDIWIVQEFLDKNSWLKVLKIQDNQIEKDLIDQYNNKPLEEMAEKGGKANNFAHFMITTQRKLILKLQYSGSVNDHLKKFMVFKNKDI